MANPEDDRPDDTPRGPSTALYSVDPSGRMVDAWIWEELLGDDDLGKLDDPYRDVVGVRPKSLGDFEGHPFRGNQYTETGGAGSVSHPATAEEHAAFYAKFEAAFKDNPYSAFVTHYTPEEMTKGKMIPLTSNGGQTGMLVKDHGDGRIEGTALFNTSKVKGAGIKLLKDAIEKHGINYAEAYGPYLPALYAALGFETEEQFKFDPSMAAPNWNTEKFDAPDYHILRLKKKGG